MQVADREQALLRPIERAVGIGDEGDGGNGDDHVRSPPATNARDPCFWLWIPAARE